MNYLLAVFVIRHAYLAMARRKLIVFHVFHPLFWLTILVYVERILL